MTVYSLDPLQDPRWSQLVARHPRGSVFHTRGWLEALERTYGYRPVAFTTCPPGTELHWAVGFCEIQSWLTGARLVSMPFSDHCDPLTDEAGQLTIVTEHLESERKARRWRYIELRPLATDVPSDSGFAVSDEYVFHALPLVRDIGSMFRAFHKSSTQRKIVRAQREGITCEEGRHAGLLRAFYRLLVITRRRHGLPPQPFAWFSNLAACVGDAMTVRIASHRGEPVAGIVTIRHGSTMVYKYGASDVRAHPLGAVHHVFWKAIQDAAAGGCDLLDLGRTDVHERGLSTFKERWGAKRRSLSYWRRPVSQRAVPARDWMAKRGADAARRIPMQLQIAAGRMLYRHLG